MLLECLTFFDRCGFGEIPSLGMFFFHTWTSKSDLDSNVLGTRTLLLGSMEKLDISTTISTAIPVPLLLLGGLGIHPARSSSNQIPRPPQPFQVSYVPTGTSTIPQHSSTSPIPVRIPDSPNHFNSSPKVLSGRTSPASFQSKEFENFLM
ncbi:hypothetical protein K402DRAFT_94874 [Aulographum hederae CBS 113979]|uniref:Uncharacterized protein n=1 Tax=Aulographum hederae CBS 113979 TaxID=1176131 RepID=A0A6G1GY79_9PEZI|nr:hypothetical protein K402DRAFT_94874 [Aulographum hederae CBS 113979]